MQSNKIGFAVQLLKSSSFLHFLEMWLHDYMEGLKNVFTKIDLDQYL